MDYVILYGFTEGKQMIWYDIIWYDILPGEKQDAVLSIELMCCL